MKKAVVIVLFLQSLLVGAQICLPIQQSNVPKNQLVVNYDFYNSASYVGTGTAVTNLASSTTGTATIFNSPTFIQTLGHISFNGVNQYLLTPNLKSYFKSITPGTFQDSHTLSLWIYPINSSGVIVTELGSFDIVSPYRDSNIEMVNSYLKFRVWPGTEILTTTNTITLNQWHHIVMVYDGSTIKGYVDGILQGSKTYARNSPINNGLNLHYAIGGECATNMGSGAYGKFNIAQFKMYNIPLNSSDITQEYDREKSKYDYTIHSPNTNTNPTYWSVSSVWDNSNGSNGPGDAFSVYHYTPWLYNTTLGWAARYLDNNQFITLNYDEPVTMDGIVTQGRANNGNQWVSSAHIDVSMDGTTWTRIVSNATLNSNAIDDVRVNFPTPTFAKYIRINPLTWMNHITMRVGVIVKPKPLVADGLVLQLDAANLKSYSGTGVTWKDISGSSNNSSLTNGPSFDPTNGGQFILDGVNDVITGTAIQSTSGNNSRTVMAWYKSTSNQNISILDKGSFAANNTAEQLFIASANSAGDVGNYPPTNPGGIYITFWGNDIYYPIPSATLYDGNWHFVSYTYDASNRSVSICFDGVFASSIYYMNGSWNTLTTKPFVLTTALNTANNPYWIGQTRAKLWGRGSEYANSSISNVSIYNRPLSEQEILVNFNALKSRYRN